MTIYQLLKEAGFIESQKGPAIHSQLAAIIVETEAVEEPFAILPGFLVPEAKPECYSREAFNNNYVVFRLESKD